MANNTYDMVMSGKSDNNIRLVLVNKCVGTTYKGRYFSVHYCQKQAYQHKC